MDRIREVRIIYDNFLGMNQQVGLQFGFDWLGYIITGVQFAALIEEAMTEDDVFGTKLGYKTRAGAMFGLYVGGQLPIQVGKYMLVPRITQSAGAGPMKTGNIYGGYSHGYAYRARLAYPVQLRGLGPGTSLRDGLAVD